MASTPTRERGTLLFLHVPKTGGTTLRQILRRQYPDDSFYHFEGGKHEQSRVRLASLPAEVRAEIRCLAGHMLFGLHIHLSQPTTYVTLLRDPVDRVVSHYYYVLRRPEHALHQAVVSKQLGLAEYAAHPDAGELHNGQTRMLAGLDGRGLPPDEMLRLAQENIEGHFVVAGLTERFDESLLLMQRQLSWRGVHYLRGNVGANRPALRQIAPEARSAILAHNQLDAALYAYAQERLDRQIAEAGPGWQGALRRFELLNGVYGRWTAAANTVRAKAAAVRGRLQAARPASR